MKVRAPFLNWLENKALAILAHSPRVGTLQVRLRGTPLTYIVRDYNDPCCEGRSASEVAPAAFDLERMFHEPAYGEEE